MRLPLWLPPATLQQRLIGLIVLANGGLWVIAAEPGLTGAAIGAAIIGLAGGGVAAWVVAGSLRRRIDAIAARAATVVRGEPRPSLVADGSGDELGTLAGVVDGVLDQLETERDGWKRAVDEVTVAEAHLARLNRDLEDGVAARTAELTNANERLVREMQRRTRIELELRQSQKLESVGRLAAGIAHEINTPIQFVSDSCHFLTDATADLTRAVNGYRALLQGLHDGTLGAVDIAEAVRELEEDADVVYLLDNLPRSSGPSKGRSGSRRSSPR